MFGDSGRISGQVMKIYEVPEPEVIIDSRYRSRTDCPQNISLSLDSFNMVLAISFTVLFFLSATPFC
jgi:hypothetical protein